jgi:hypothetical protein
MKQKTTHNWQNLPSEIQNTSESKTVSKSLEHPNSSVLSKEDLMGLSWILFEERH